MTDLPAEATTAADLVRQYMQVMQEATDAARRSVLDGTVSCRLCRALVLQQNQDAHLDWHAHTERL